MKVPLGERHARFQGTASGQTGADVAVSPQFGHLAETDMVENLAIAGSARNPFVRFRKVFLTIWGEAEDFRICCCPRRLALQCVGQQDTCRLQSLGFKAYP